MAAEFHLTQREKKKKRQGFLCTWRLKPVCQEELALVYWASVSKSTCCKDQTLMISSFLHPAEK